MSKNQTPVAKQETPVEPIVEPASVVEETPVLSSAISPDWPFDPHGFTSGLRREVARTVGRIRGHDEKMDIFMAHLRAAAEWARNRHEVNKVIAADAAAYHDTARERAAELSAVAGAPELTPDQQAARQAAAGVMGVVHGA